MKSDRAKIPLAGYTCILGFGPIIGRTFRGTLGEPLADALLPTRQEKFTPISTHGVACCRAVRVRGGRFASSRLKELVITDLDPSRPEAVRQSSHYPHGLADSRGREP